MGDIRNKKDVLLRQFVRDNKVHFPMITTFAVEIWIKFDNQLPIFINFFYQNLDWTIIEEIQRVISGLRQIMLLEYALRMSMINICSSQALTQRPCTR